MKKHEIAKKMNNSTFSIKEGGSPYTIDSEHGAHVVIRNIHTGHTNIIPKDGLKKFDYIPNYETKPKYKKSKRK